MKQGAEGRGQSQKAGGRELGAKSSAEDGRN